MKTEEKPLRKQFLAQRDRIDALLGNLHVDLTLYSLFENILDGGELLPKEVSAYDFLVYLNEMFEEHFHNLRDAWHAAEAIYDRMAEQAKN